MNIIKMKKQSTFQDSLSSHIPADLGGRVQLIRNQIPKSLTWIELSRWALRSISKINMLKISRNLLSVINSGLWRDCAIFLQYIFLFNSIIQYQKIQKCDHKYCPQDQLEHCFGSLAWSVLGELGASFHRSYTQVSFRAHLKFPILQDWKLTNINNCGLF